MPSTGNVAAAALVTDFDQTWSEIDSQGLQLAFSIAQSGDRKLKLRAKEFMPVYNKIYGMCVQAPPYNWSGKLYYALSDALVRQCTSQIEPSLQQQADTSILHEFLVTWERYLAVVQWCCAAFKYLDRFFVRRLALPSVRAVAVVQFRDHVFRPILPRVVARFVQRVREERTLGSQLPDSQVLRRICQTFVDIGLGSSKLYRAELETALLVASKAQLDSMSGVWLEASDCPTYLDLVERQLALEKGRVSTYLQPCTAKKIESVCLAVLVNAKKERIVNDAASGCRHMLQDQNADALKRLFKLMQAVPGGTALISAQLKVYIKSHGIELMDALWKESATISKVATTPFAALVLWYSQVRTIVATCFQDNHVLFRTLKDSFEQVLNAEPSTAQNSGGNGIAELMSEYIDKILRSGDGQLRSLVKDSSPTRHIELLVDLFSFVNDKDVFAESYRKKLAKRMLLEKSASRDMELTVVESLRRICGAPYVSKIAGIIKDVTLAGDVQSAFVSFLKQAPGRPLGFDMNVRVLTSSFWPSYKEDSMVVPQAFEHGMSAFKEFYNTRTAHRTLRWVHSLGTVTLIATVGADAARYDLVLNTFQACALILFNKGVGPETETNTDTDTRLTLTEMANRLNVQEKQLAKHVVSLCFGKFKLLDSDAPSAAQVEDKTQFSLNHGFKDRSRRIKVPLLANSKAEERQKESSQSNVQVREERKHVVEAAIVRIMKSQRRIKHERLVVQTVARLKDSFKVEPTLVKTRVEDLIERDYIERDATDMSTYLYVA